LSAFAAPLLRTTCRRVAADAKRKRRTLRVAATIIDLRFHRDVRLRTMPSGTCPSTVRAGCSICRRRGRYTRAPADAAGTMPMLPMSRLRHKEKGVAVQKATAGKQTLQQREKQAKCAGANRGVRDIFLMPGDVAVAVTFCFLRVFPFFVHQHR